MAQQGQKEQILVNPADIQEARRLARLLVGDTTNLNSRDYSEAENRMDLSRAERHAAALVAQLALLREQHNGIEAGHIMDDGRGN